MPEEIPELARLLELEGEEALRAHIEAAIEDCTGKEAMRSKDPKVRQYSPQVRCGESLREKWPQITAAAARRGRPKLTPEEFAREVAGA